ncbi:YraN family protein [Anoxybacter fermentans]|uniref:UPF0102 protein BBF96_02485 n=1 Tax=Anoxybacter fermentans TaxID=1323375 RepID=A0A3S9SVQ4_9FIRM|nr:YraN family protein [Anoxybacter fermentans]AZR72358.1 YraN family protein [Anoxybacter fermentans]
MKKVELGRLGEKLARDYFLKAGYNILAENYRTPLGEIDLVVEKDKTIIFVEVRTRSTPSFGAPEESISRSKRERLIRLALQFCAHHYLYSQNLRFDVIAISFFDNEPKIEHIKNAFFAGGN